MTALPPRTLLARLRTSARLSVLVLLIFALKIGAAAACAKHDFADLGFGTSDGHSVVQAVDGVTGDESQPSVAFSHAGTCSHCGCHHASAVPPEAFIAPTILAHTLISFYAGVPPDTSHGLELRPPIA